VGGSAVTDPRHYLHGLQPIQPTDDDYFVAVEHVQMHHFFGTLTQLLHVRPRLRGQI
jgi:hypothetical protein